MNNIEESSGNKKYNIDSKYSKKRSSYKNVDNQINIGNETENKKSDLVNTITSIIKEFINTVTVDESSAQDHIDILKSNSECFQFDFNPMDQLDNLEQKNLMAYNLNLEKDLKRIQEQNDTKINPHHISMKQQLQLTNNFYEENNNDYVFLLSKDLNKKMNINDFREFSRELILQREINVQFVHILNSLQTNGIFYKKQAEASPVFLQEITRIENEEMCKNIIDYSKQKRYSLTKLQDDHFKKGMIQQDGEEWNSRNTPIKEDTLTLENIENYTKPLMQLIAQFRELIDEKIKQAEYQDLKGTIRSQFNKIEEYNPSINVIFKHDMPKPFKYQEIKYISKSLQYEPKIFLAEKAFFDRNEDIEVDSDDIYNIFKEIMEIWLDFQLDYSENVKQLKAKKPEYNTIGLQKQADTENLTIDTDLNPKQDISELDNITNPENKKSELELQNKTNVSIVKKKQVEVKPIYINAKKKKLFRLAQYFNVPLRIKESINITFLDQTFLKKYNSQDQNQMQFKSALNQYFEDNRHQKQLDNNSSPLDNTFKITGCTLSDLLKQVNKPTLCNQNLLSQSTRQQLIYQKISQYFNLDVFKRFGTLNDFFPLHNIPEWRLLNLRYANLMSQYDNFFITLNEHEIQDLKDYQGSYYAFYFLFVNNMIKNYKQACKYMIPVCIIQFISDWWLWLHWSGIKIFYVINAISQFTSICITCNYAVSTYISWLSVKEQYNRKWGGKQISKQAKILNINFKGKIGYSQITGLVVTLQDKSRQHQINIALSYGILVIACLFIGLFTYILGIFKGIILNNFHPDDSKFLFLLFSFIVGFFLGAQIKICNKIQGQQSRITTEWENHKYQSSFERSHFLKLFLFRIVNAQLTLFKTAVINQSQDTCSNQTVQMNIKNQLADLKIDDCFTDNSINIMMIFVTLVIWNYVDLQLCHQNTSSVLEDGNSWLDEQIAFEKRESLNADQMDLLIENGFVILFGSTNPLVFILLMYNCQMILNNDLVNIISKTKRCVPRFSRRIGFFEYFQIFLLVLSIITNSIILVFNSKMIMALEILFWPSDLLIENNKIQESSNTVNTMYRVFQMFHWIYVIYFLINLGFFQQFGQYVNKIHYQRNDYISSEIDQKLAQANFTIKKNLRDKIYINMTKNLSNRTSKRHLNDNIKND